MLVTLQYLGNFTNKTAPKKINLRCLYKALEGTSKKKVPTFHIRESLKDMTLDYWLLSQILVEIALCDRERAERKVCWIN